MVIFMTTKDLSACDLLRKACDIYKGDRSLAESLFNSDVPALGNKKPNDLLGSPEGRQQVNELLNKMECGEFS
ncbi:hypothetical protein swp_1016 [Shewanella piezotolerans WP3]|uniref:Antitoxin Xre/MbcA/ParS-like toxin-binding domain-containing protein n=2 Tax=Shewanella TaxID=22 RepID=B8CJ57_SHEPW|nr:hypothetical protein swp_1016 [Shewanella piezotolerans WP3]